MLNNSSYALKVNNMNREQLIAEANELETKITVYSERDWLAAEAHIQKLKVVDAKILDLMVEDDMIKAGETKVG